MNIVAAEDLRPGDTYETPQLRTFVAHHIVVREFNTNTTMWARAVTVMNKGNSDLYFPVGQPLRLIQRP